MKNFKVNLQFLKIENGKKHSVRISDLSKIQLNDMISDLRYWHKNADKKNKHTKQLCLEFNEGEEECPKCEHINFLKPYKIMLKCEKCGQQWVGKKYRSNLKKNRIRRKEYYENKQKIKNE